MTELFNNGFEEGDFSAWTGTTGSPQVVTDKYHHGTKSMYVDASENAYKDYTPQTTVFQRVLVLFPDLSGLADYQTQVFLHVYYGTTRIAGVGINHQTGNNFRWFLQRHFPSQVNFTSANFTAESNVWYSVKIKFVRDASGEYRVYVGGVEKVSDVGVDTTGVAGASRIYAGNIYNTYRIPHYIDCVVVSSTDIEEEGGAILKEVTDSLSLSDAVLRDKSFTVSDSIGLSDIILSDRSFVLTDAIGLFDEVFRSRLIEILEGLGLNDQIEVPSRALIVTDSIGLSEFLSLDKNLVVLDSATLTDGALVDKILQVLDAVALSELAEKWAVGAGAQTKIFLIIGNLAIQLTGKN